jgi:hypothetical protein
MKINILFLSAFLLIFTSSCSRYYVSQGRVVKQFSYHITVHPWGENQVRVYISDPLPRPDSLEWIDIMMSAFKIASLNALEVDILQVRFIREPYGGEICSVSLSNYNRLISDHIETEEWFKVIDVQPLHPQPRSFFAPL